MTCSSNLLNEKNLDNLSFNLDSLRNIPELSSFVIWYLDGDYHLILQSSTSIKLCNTLIDRVSSSEQITDTSRFFEGLSDDINAIRVFIIGLSAFNAFLQANVTGPSFDWGKVFPQAKKVRKECLSSLDVDGMSVCQNISFIELFCLSRMILTEFFPRVIEGVLTDCKWMSLRINVFHQRLLFSSSGRSLRDLNLLQDTIDQNVSRLNEEIFGPKSKFSTEQKVEFSLEKAQIYIMQGSESKARESIQTAKRISGFDYGMSGALGKRTKFQQTDVSQLVVFARSNKNKRHSKTDYQSIPLNGNHETSKLAPEALKLNDDTLLESILFSNKTSETSNSSLPPELIDLKPDNQPQLDPLDQIILLTEATLKDQLSPLDELRSEEILPYSTRVLNDKSTNWQIYTHALLVRSRIEFHRSRTQERSILQLQVIVDQITSETREDPKLSTNSDINSVKTISSFMPKGNLNESAKIQDRLRYIFSLNTPTRWELETELAFAWSKVGSFYTALEIFKRLQLWAEVALCYHSVSQEQKARRTIRRQLFFSEKGGAMDNYNVDSPELESERWEGKMRPNPPNAPRLWCILGDLDDDPLFWNHAWEISKHRYARAQRSLGEYFTKCGKLDKAREAYIQASNVNRQNEDTWSRLGDIELKLGNWDSAIFAFQHSIMLDDTNAKTYSNLGSALLSKHVQFSSNQIDVTSADPKFSVEDDFNQKEKENSLDNMCDPNFFITQALGAYKRAASLAHSNWKIWDNVVTISLRISPPSYKDLLLGLRNVIRIRAPSIGEAAIDADALNILILGCISQERTPNSNIDEAPAVNGGKYIPPRGSLARATLQLLQEDIIPLLTSRPELYEIVKKMALYQMDYEGVIESTSKAWRCLMRDETWLLDANRWAMVVESTVMMTDALEKFGPMLKIDSSGTLIERRWKEKSRKAIKSVLGRAEDTWEESEGWNILQEKLKEFSR